MAGIDYTKLDGPALLAECGADAKKWAEAFNQHAVKFGYPEMDEGWLISWFANAIEHSYDVRTGTGPVVLPDGSAFFIGVVRGDRKLEVDSVNVTVVKRLLADRDAQQSRAEKAEADLAKMREALRPFADETEDDAWDGADDHEFVGGHQTLTVGDLRRAAALLKETSP